MPGYQNQVQQPGPYRTENTFQKGLQLDTPADNTPNVVLTGGLNLHLLRQQGSELMLATEPGMARRCLLPPNHLVHGWAERGGVLYLLLSEVDPASGQATGRGQLGTYPSPDYQQLGADSTRLVEAGELRWRYQALRVYYGDSNQNQLQGLESQWFNLSLDAPAELELQDSYDGTLNLVLNDRGRNPALLINSGFVVLPPRAGDTGALDGAVGAELGSPGRYQIIVREGDAQTNRYRPADFQSRLRLHPRGGSLAKGYLRQVTQGGTLAGGEYRYYFSYCDADGNETDLCCEVGPVSVLEASTPAAARGTRPGENTSLRVVLQLAELDPTFGFVRVRYVRRGGEPEATASGYELEQKVRVSPAGTVDFSHTGYEVEQPVSVEQLEQLAGSVSRFSTMCQAGGRLLLGGITTAGLDETALLAFAAATKLGHEQVRLNQVAGLDAGTSAGVYQLPGAAPADSVPAGFTLDTYPRAAWSGGYLNALNSCYRRGYMAGESYAFGVRFILDDYSVTETYPLRGVDNLTNAEYEEAYQADADPSFYGYDGWQSGGGAQNRRGVYRFPLRRNDGGGLRPLVEQNSNAVNALAARVTIPALSPELRRRAVGVQFMRAPRRADCLVQGYAVPTLRSLVVPPGGNKPYDHHDGAARDALTGKTTGNVKVLPAVRGTLETCDRDYGNKQKSEVVGVFPFTFYQQTSISGQTLRLLDDRRFAFYAPEAVLRPAYWLSRLNERSIRAFVTSTVFCKAAVAYNNSAGTTGAPGGSWTLYKTTHQQGVSFVADPYLPGKTSWVLDNQDTPNAGRFASQERYLLGKHANDQKFLVNLAWESYVGLQLDAADLDGGNGRPAINGGVSGPNTGLERYSQQAQVLAGSPVASAYLVNLYNGGGPLDNASLRQLYQPDQLAYVPISQRLSWAQLEQQLDGSRRLLLFGGDTFVGLVQRRLFRALPKDQRLEEKFDAPLGQLLSLVCETQAHPYARSEEAVSAGVESGASFSPRLGYEKQDLNAVRGPLAYNRPESTRYNAGYGSEGSSSGALVTGTARAENVPYRRQDFAARVWASAPSIDGSFSNGYRFLPALGFRDYERQLGKIMRLLPAGEQQVLVVHEHGLELLGLSEQTLAGQNAAGPVYAQALGFLPPQGRILSRELGCQHPHAVCVSPKGAYGVDATQGCVWFWAFGAGQVTRLSDFSVQALLGPVLKSYRGKTVALAQLDIQAVYDPSRADVVFSLYQKS